MIRSQLILYFFIFRNDFDDEDPSAFEAELAMLDEVEAEMMEGDSQETGEGGTAFTFDHFDTLYGSNW